MTPDALSAFAGLRERLDRRSPESADLVKLLSAVDELEPDAIAVLAMVAERLAMGRKQYTDLDVATDKRNYIAELMAELLDGQAYAAMQLVRLSRGETRPR